MPLIFGGKIYNGSIMTFKIVSVMGFLIVLAIFQSHWKTWAEISSGFLKFGSVPIHSVEEPQGDKPPVEANQKDSDTIPRDARNAKRVRLALEDRQAAARRQ